MKQLAERRRRGVRQVAGFTHTSAWRGSVGCTPWLQRDRIGMGERQAGKSWVSGTHPAHP
jgi:hypothetical protein